jgi:hypothetical protein
MDAPGTLHHIMGRGIERTNIFRNRRDREDLLSRLAALCKDGNLFVYAWALMPNHFHLLDPGTSGDIMLNSLTPDESVGQGNDFNNPGAVRRLHHHLPKRNG